MAELGYGPHLSDSRLSSAWNWSVVAHNPGFDFSGNNDEFFANLSIFEVGVFSYSFRYSLDSGASWTLADQDGNQNGIDLNLLGTATVTTVSPGGPLPAVPVPAALWLFATAIVGLVGIRRHRTFKQQNN